MGKSDRHQKGSCWFYVQLLDIQVIIRVFLVIVVISIGLVKNLSWTWAWAEQGCLSVKQSGQHFRFININKSKRSKNCASILLLFAEHKGKCEFLLCFPFWIRQSKVEGQVGRWVRLQEEPQLHLQPGKIWLQRIVRFYIYMQYYTSCSPGSACLGLTWLALLCNVTVKSSWMLKTSS